MLLNKDEILKKKFEAIGLAKTIGASRQARPIQAYCFGKGKIKVSLIAGCHADEPIGPWMLEKLCAYLDQLEPGHPLLKTYTWNLIPHTNPDGEERNKAWATCVTDTVPPEVYVTNVVREAPGDDLEFGFPRNKDDKDARPENKAIAAFLKEKAPFDLHISFHGMSIARGPWFLIGDNWIDKTKALRDNLVKTVAKMKYLLHSDYRTGEKGFIFIEEGFSTCPNSVAMGEFFLKQNNQEMADKFRPSSMEYVRSLGGDPLTLVSEMPLFLYDPESNLLNDNNPANRVTLKSARENQGIRKKLLANLSPMPIEDQMRLQIEFLNQGLQSLRDK